MKVASEDARNSRVTLEDYPDLLAVRALPDYRFVARDQVLVDTADLAELGIVAPVEARSWDIVGPLFDYQRWIVDRAIERERFAIFALTGTGKTIMQLEWARIVTGFHGGRTLIVAPLGVCSQTIRECARFYDSDVLTVQDLTDRKRLNAWLDSGSGVGITNYEKFDGAAKHVADDMGSLKYQQGDVLDVQAVVLDESSMLRGFGSRKFAIVRAFDGIRWKLCCSATPAPNQRTEFAQHALFLAYVRSTTEYLTAYFMNRDGDWEFKPHAFNAWIGNLASWAVFLRDPARWGFNSDYDLPELVEEFPPIELTDAQLSRARVHEHGDQPSLFGATPGGITSRTKLAQISNGFELIEGDAEFFPSLKPEAVAQLVNERHRLERCIVWIKYREEGRQLGELIPDAVVLDGQSKRAWRDEQIEAFAAGHGPRVLVAMQSMFSHGLNLQACDVQVFSTQDDSFERRFQSIRRSLRFGRTEPVTVYTPLTQLDVAAANNTLAKAAMFESDSTTLEDAMIGRLRPQDTSEARIVDTSPAVELDRTEQDRWTMIHGDSIAHLPKMGDESIDLAVFSPPFAALYAYSEALGDMGNVRADTEFALQWQWFAERLLPKMVPGRVVAIHAKEIIRFANTHGYRHCHDFPSDLRDGMVAAGFRYQRRITIWKNPQLEATRNKETSLLHVTAIRDAANSFPQTGEYVMVFTAPGDNPKPVVHDRDAYSFEQHTQWMNTIWPEPPPQEEEDRLLFEWLHSDGPADATAWHGIRETDVLTAATAKESPEEKHVCPLQLSLIDRCVQLWTNQGELVFSPFAGIGSEGWSALGLGRRFYGIELKRSYYDTACKNLKRRAASTAASLFDHA